MQERRDWLDDLPPRSTVRCASCSLPVVRTWSDPPVLLHQAACSHPDRGRGVIDLLFSEVESACAAGDAPVLPDTVDIDSVPYVTLQPPRDLWGGRQPSTPTRALTLTVPTAPVTDTP
jgi:hypothetical protein